MTYVHIKPEVKRNDTTALTALTIKACVSWFMKTAIWWGGNDSFDKGGCKFGEGDFSGGGNE